MLKCNVCSREFKNKSGLTIHKKVCKPILEESESKETVEVSKTIDEVVKMSSDACMTPKSRLSKIKDAYNSCYDAEAKYKLECEYKSLGGIIEDLRKK